MQIKQFHNKVKEQAQKIIACIFENYTPFIFLKKLSGVNRRKILAQHELTNKIYFINIF